MRGCSEQLKWWLAILKAVYRLVNQRAGEGSVWLAVWPHPSSTHWKVPTLCSLSFHPIPLPTHSSPSELQGTQRWQNQPGGTGLWASDLIAVPLFGKWHCTTPALTNGRGIKWTYWLEKQSMTWRENCCFSTSRSSFPVSSSTSKPSLLFLTYPEFPWNNINLETCFSTPGRIFSSLDPVPGVVLLSPGSTAFAPLWEEH